MAKITKNTRQHARVKKSYLIKYKGSTAASTEKLSNIRDIGGGGLSFLTNDSSLVVGKKITMEILIPKFKEPVKAYAEVVRVARAEKRKRCYAVGVRFTRISAANKKIVEDFKAQFGKKGTKSFFFFDMPDVVVRNR